MSAAPSPLTPAGLDLRSLSYMPLHVERLLISETWLIATGDEAKAAMTLWCRAWHQVPAASLPNDDRLLAALSGAGSKWRKVKEVALRGFVLCSDGRLYHTLLAAEAMEALEKRERWRTKKRRQRGGPEGGQNEDVPEDTQGDIPEDTAGDTRGETALRDGTGRDNDQLETPSEGARARKSSKSVMTEDWHPNEAAKVELRSQGYSDDELDWQRMRFAKHFKGKSGDDWDGRFVQWVTREPVGKYAKRAAAKPDGIAVEPWDKRVRDYRDAVAAGKTPFWLFGNWGQPPGDNGCIAPADVLKRYGFAA